MCAWPLVFGLWSLPRPKAKVPKLFFGLVQRAGERRRIHL